jgi:hypothetical protein
LFKGEAFLQRHRPQVSQNDIRKAALTYLN